jgi:hypothetical protein
MIEFVSSSCKCLQFNYFIFACVIHNIYIYIYIYIYMCPPCPVSGGCRACVRYLYFRVLVLGDLGYALLCGYEQSMFR